MADSVRLNALSAVLDAATMQTFRGNYVVKDTVPSLWQIFYGRPMINGWRI